MSARVGRGQGAEQEIGEREDDVEVAPIVLMVQEMVDGQKTGKSPNPGKTPIGGCASADGRRSTDDCGS
jgi:hypothetical protein